MANFSNPRVTEKRFHAIPPQALIADGLSDGTLTIANTYCFKVGQIVNLVSSSVAPYRLKIKAILSETIIKVGPIDKPIFKFSNISNLTIADGAMIELIDDSINSGSQASNRRPVIDLHEIIRQTYEEEPTVAFRTHNVDWLGRSYGADNPLPVTGISGAAEQEIEPTHFESSIVTAGTPDILTIPGKDIQLAFIFNPNKGPSKNGGNDVLFVTIDGSVNKVTVPRGSSRYFPGKMTSFNVDSNANATNYEVILWSNI